jgi:agmatine deiminase
MRLPAEWEPHEATWLAWPHERTDWPGKFEPIAWVYGEVVRYLSRFEPVCIVIRPEDRRAAAKTLRHAGAEMGAVRFFTCQTDRSWMRDTCPIFVRDARDVAMTHWRFKAWAKYANWRRDARLPEFLERKLRLPRHETGLVLEGGAIDSNGRGCLLTTEQCLLSDVQQRNPGLDRAGYEAAFARWLGIRKTLWLRRGIAGDDTHGHVDDVARFVAPSTVVAAVEPDRGDANHEPLRENLQLLRGMTDERGRPLRVEALPMPAPLYFNGQRLPASYANFYIANGLVLAPTFNDPNDRVALNTLARLFPRRQVVGIHSVDLVLGLGTLHCLTMQQPAAIAE